jgi:RNA polymerase sigma factor (sigma-70 family)
VGQEAGSYGALAGLLSAFLECRASLRRAVGRIVKPHDIEDIVQETFIRSYEAAGKSSIQHPRSFMFKTARNLALNHISCAESRLTRTIEDFSDSDVFPSTEPLESSYEAREQYLLFCSAVRQLPVQCRRAFLLKKVYGLSQKEIAEYLGISQSTAEKHIAKGMLICRQYMRVRSHGTGNGAAEKALLPEAHLVTKTVKSAR